MMSNTHHLHIGNVRTAAQQNTSIPRTAIEKKSINKIQTYSPGVATDHLFGLWAMCSRLTQMPDVSHWPYGVVSRRIGKRSSKGM